MNKILAIPVLSNSMTLAALLAIGAQANIANAEEVAALQFRFDEKSIVLHFGDLNPARPADASTLLARVRHAVETACTRNDEVRQIFLANDRKACLAEGYANGVAGINRKRNVDLEAVAANHQPNAKLEAASR